MDSGEGREGRQELRGDVFVRAGNEDAFLGEERGKTEACECCWDGSEQRGSKPELGDPEQLRIPQERDFGCPKTTPPPPDPPAPAPW